MRAVPAKKRYVSEQVRAAPGPSGHRCHAARCRVSVPPALLMCGRHWRLVPRSLQRDIWRTYRPGQERDKRPSWEYLALADLAVAHVAAAEFLR